MKNPASSLCLFLMALLPLALTSCDEDTAIAYTLEGTWRGNMYVSSVYDGYTYDATYSELCFTQDPYTYSSGTGYWIDFYSNAPWDYVANHTQWTVRNGIITIYLVEEGATVQIGDYRLDDGNFYGTIYYGDTRVSFDLVHTSSPNWNNYNYGYDYWYSYYAKPQAFTDSTRQGTMGRATVAGQPVRRFRTQK